MGTLFKAPSLVLVRSYKDCSHKGVHCYYHRTYLQLYKEVSQGPCSLGDYKDLCFLFSGLWGHCLKHCHWPWLDLTKGYIVLLTQKVLH